jgi:hypothetical protein
MEQIERNVLIIPLDYAEHIQIYVEIVKRYSSKDNQSIETITIQAEEAISVFLKNLSLISDDQIEKEGEILYKTSKTNLTQLHSYVQLTLPVRTLFAQILLLNALFLSETIPRNL